MASQCVIDYLRGRLMRIESAEDLKLYWIDNLGDTYKDDPDVVAAFKERRKQLDGFGASGA